MNPDNSSQAETKHTTREAYLLAAVELCKPMFDRVGVKLPPVHVSTGWPSGRSPSAKQKALGECWDSAASADQVHQIFISPWMPDPLHVRENDASGVLPTLVHELVHAAVGLKCGHKGQFRKVATDLGLEGPMTATHAGEILMNQLRDMLPLLGRYPHAKLEPSLRGKKKQGTRMVKCECMTCGYIVRTSRKWIDLGTPSCPVGHGTMHTEIPDEGDNE